MLALGIRYLNGYVIARTGPDDHEAEWPPHPGRVFMALAAAYFQTGEDPRERDALCWLEALQTGSRPAAPYIVAPDAVSRAVVTHYVPVNDRNDGFTVKDKRVVVFPEIGQTGLRRERQPRSFIRAWLAEDTVFFVWPDAEPEESTRNSLEALCAKVTRIGHSSSLVQMWVACKEQVGEYTWVPDNERAVIQVRIAPAGTLEYLENRFNQEAVQRFTALKIVAADSSNKSAQRKARNRLKDEFADEPPAPLRPNLSVFQGYAQPIPPSKGTAAPGTVFSPHLIVRRFEREKGPYRHLDLSCVLAVADCWRAELLRHANHLPAPILTMLSGHDSQGLPLQAAHLAFVPLAFVGHDRADGHLLGMGIALPDGLPGEVRRDILRALGGVRELTLGGLGLWRLDAVTEMEPAWSLRSTVWTAYPGGATHWSSVTPLVFDYHPKAKNKQAYCDEVAVMITQCCTRVGLPAPRDVIVTAVSAHTGVPTIAEFPFLWRKNGSQPRHVHAILAFDEPVCGPVLLGAGRYRGYGAFRPIGVTNDAGFNQ